MKISGVDYRDINNFTVRKKNNKERIDSFSNELTNSLLNQSKKELKDLLLSIKKKGTQIVLTKTHSDVVEYKNLVKEYLKKVMEDIYEIEKCYDTFDSRYYLTVETIDEKLKELTDKILGGEKDNISILTTIDEIQGLMVDIYK